MFTDTDTLVYEIENSAVYEDKKKIDKKTFGWPKNVWLKWIFRILSEKMEDGTKGVPIAEFVELKSKMYLFIKDDGLEWENSVAWKEKDKK